MAKNEKTSKAVSSLASRALAKPQTVTIAEIKRLAASVLTQAPDKPKKSSPPKAPAKKK